jgi:tRNA threonylcarbamoyladenosine biosynthesis protein TsaB
MTRALAIETSGRDGSIALVDADTVVAEQQFAHGLKNAAMVLPLIDGMCRAQGWTPADVRTIYVSAGPGSFTGLRIGITLSKSLAFATGARIVAVPSTRVLVENAPPEAQSVIIVLDAKRDQIFTARFQRRSDRWAEIEPAHLDSLSQMLARAPRPVHLLGEGISFHTKFIPADDQSIVVTEPSRWRAQARIVAKLGVEMARRGEFTEPDALSPIYIRRPEAEEKADLNESRK